MSNVMILKTAKAGRHGVEDIVGDCKDEIEQVLSGISMVVDFGHDGLQPNRPDSPDPDSPDPDTILRFLRMLEGHLQEANSGLREAMKRLTEPEPPKGKATPKRDLKVQ